jgi:hypothetical protein
VTRELSVSLCVFRAISPEVVSATANPKAEGILDVEMKGERMRKYYKLTEAGTKETKPTHRNWKIYPTMQSLVNPKPI